MKKKVRSQIRAIANQIIEDENSLNTVSLKQKIGALYEQLSVLEFLESQIEENINSKEEDSLDSKSFREENWFTEPEPVPQPKHKEDLVEPLMEKIKDIVAQMPEESQQVDDLLEKVLPQQKFVKNDLEEFASRYQQTPTFERKEPAKGVDVIKSTESKVFPLDKNTKKHATKTDTYQEDKPVSINDKLNQGLSIGLNDRLAFIKHLFNGNVEDYTRVLSQINTMQSFDQADAFIKGKIKPDYNYWLQKEEYSERFMSIVEKSFN